MWRIRLGEGKADVCKTSARLIAVATANSLKPGNVPLMKAEIK